MSYLVPTFSCPKGCEDMDDCRASLAIPCALPAPVDETGQFAPCGCLKRSVCGGCQVCTECDGCYCGED